jgi:NAD(P)-dependent dehydrogenase (short-subunit alcohol dehydrogenase family)
MRRTILRLAAASWLALAATTAGAADPPRHAVLVTGASTGIGRAITEHLAAEGHFVYAGARKEKDLEELARIPNVQPVRLDVTSATDIAAAVETIAGAGRGLYALVNNAGVAVSGTFADTTEEDFHFAMNVNAYGPWRVTKAFLPLLLESRGRVTTIGSISGIISSANLGVYSMSKHAAEAFTDSLALQVEPKGVRVSVVEPGNYDSQIGASAVRRAGADPKLGDRSQYKPPDEVAAAVRLALFEPTPKRRYLVVPNAQEGEYTIRTAIQELVQLNEGHAYTYDRDALVRMLDEALTKARPRTPAGQEN